MSLQVGWNTRRALSTKESIVYKNGICWSNDSLVCLGRNSAVVEVACMRKMLFLLRE